MEVYSLDVKRKMKVGIERRNNGTKLVAMVGDEISGH